MNPPVLIVGLHRSGTSILAEMLAATGIFLGTRVDEHHESVFHARINRRLDDELGAHWSNPLPIVDFLLTNGVDAGLVAPLEKYCESALAVEYWGRAYRPVAKRPAHWGWKDPRNGHLLPIWQATYPGLRVIRIKRHPAASALSLYDRTVQVRSEIAELAAKPWPHGGLVRRMTRRQPMLSDAWRLNTKAGALEVALDCYEADELMLDAVDVESTAVDYEQLVTAPRATLEALTGFLGFHADAERLESAAALASTRSLHRWRNDPEFVRLADENHERLKRFGFDE